MHTLVEQAMRLQEMHKLSDRQFARRLGVDPSSWSRVKRGLRPPGMKILRALVKEFPGLELAAYQYIASLRQEQ